MSNVASLENCKELYELSEWRDCEWQYWNGEANNDISEITLEWGYGNYGDNCAPAYDAGFLLRKLPRVLETDFKDKLSQLSMIASNINGYTYYYPYTKYTATSQNLEDAACKLVIELWKQGILHD